MALPLRRNSQGGGGEEDEFSKMFGSKKKSKSKDESTHYSLRMERKKKTTQANNHSAEYLCRNTSSSESLENIIKGGRKGFSLDRSFENDTKPQMKPKRSSWFLRDKNRDKQSNKNEKFFKRASLDFSVAYDTKQVVDNTPAKPRSKAKTIYRQNAADYTGGDSSTTPQEEIADPIKKLSKFQIGKRFLKGEIGIRSFNYYLLKEGLKKSNSKQKTEKAPFMSKSEENIYEEIFFHDQPKKPLTPLQPPNLPPPNKLQGKQQTDEGNCLNCEICLQEAQEKHKMQNCDKCEDGDHHQQQQQQTVMLAAEGYATVTRKLDNVTIYDFFQQQSPSAHGGNTGGGILQFQSYNPNNPNVYKIETTPVAFSEYNLTAEEQLYQQHYAALIALQQQQQQQQQHSGDGKIMTKSSSSNDSIRQQQQQQTVNEFYTRPNYIYPSTNTTATSMSTSITGIMGEQKQSSMRRDKNNSIYKTDSSNSLRSENSLNRNSQKSNSIQNSGGRIDDMQMRQDMSDSSLGDSLFSSDANKRYFGSSESCRFNYECERQRRCSLEENEKCSFSDTCRNYETECNLQNCDCSSSYFSSDFDDTNNIYGINNRNIKSYHNNNENYHQIHYAEDFIKHVSNVKRRSQNIPYDALISTTSSIYEVPKANPKRLDVMIDTMVRNNVDNNNDEMAIREMLTHVENNKNTLKAATGTIPKLSISSNDSKKSSNSHRSTNQKQMPKDMSRNHENNEDCSLSKNTQGNSTETSCNSVERKTIAVDNNKKQQQQPHGIMKTENDTTSIQQKVPTVKNEHPKIVLANTTTTTPDDNDDDEVFLSHATAHAASVAVANSTMAVTSEEKKSSEKPTEVCVSNFLISHLIKLG